MNLSHEHFDDCPRTESYRVTGPGIAPDYLTSAYVGVLSHAEHSDGTHGYRAAVLCGTCKITTARVFDRYDVGKAYIEAGVLHARACTGRSVVEAEEVTPGRMDAILGAVAAAAARR